MKTQMIHFVVLLFLITLSSCSNRELTLEQVENYPVKFAKQKVTLDSDNFSVMLPKDWDWRNEKEDCDGENFLVMLNAASPADKDGYISVISIQKIKSQSSSNDLETEYNYLLSLSNNQSQGLKMIESGKTDIFNYTAYYFHTKSETGTYGQVENISFLLNSDRDGYFYHLTAGGSQTKELKKNLSVMIHSLRTFKIES